MLDTTPLKNPKNHRYRPLGATGHGGHWHNASGDDLVKSRVPLDTTPLANNPKNYRFRAGADSRIIYKTKVKLGGK